MGNPAPIINSTAESGVTIRHREFVGDVVAGGSADGYGVGGFKPYTFNINPGNDALFPWLSTLAVNFQEYRLDGLLMQFRSTSGDAVANTNTSLGTICMSTQYNAAMAPFINKVEMENSQFGQSCKPSESMTHFIETSKHQSAVSDTLFVRNQAIPNTTDPRLYDKGIFQIASVGCPGDGSFLGELWVSYQVTLFKPINSNTMGFALMQESMYCATGVTASLAAGSTTTYNAYGSTGKVVTANNTEGWQSNAYGVQLTADTANSFSFHIPVNKVLQGVPINVQVFYNSLTGAAAGAFGTPTLGSGLKFSNDEWLVGNAAPGVTQVTPSVASDAWANFTMMPYNTPASGYYTVTWPVTLTGVTSGSITLKIRTGLGYDTLNL